MAQLDHEAQSPDSPGPMGNIQEDRHKMEQLLKNWNQF